VLIGWLLYKYRIRQLKKTYEMRSGIAKDLHDEIGSTLSNINILNELARRNQENPAKSNEYLNKAGEDIQRISESLGDIVWNINPRYDDLQNLFVRMKRYASDMMDGKNISYEMSFPEEAASLSLSMGRRRDFYLIFKEAINNLVKYSKATEAKVIIETEGKKMRMTITDNGIGFDSSQPQYGNGINNMRQRAGTWKDQLEIKSVPGKGTEVMLEMNTG
jgi:signal transduction histidine kinase